jgi:PAS domain S-box-containing protein
VSPSHLDERDDSNVKFLVNQPHSTLARLLSVFPEIVIVLDADGKLLWANDLAQNLFSRSLDESIGISVIDFVHPDDLEMVLRSFETVQGKQMGNPIEVRVKVESKWRLLESIGVPVSWYQEGAILFSIRDLTDRRGGPRRRCSLSLASA